MGENGAGKSTLIKVLTGVYSLDGGTITLDGESVRFASPLQAQQAGISTVYQEVNLCPNLSVAENIFIGREPTRFGRIQWKRLRQEAAELVDRLGLDIDVTAPLSSYPLAVQQLVAIVGRWAPTARQGTKVLILDEPTSSLDRDEVLELFRLMRRLKDEGVAILFVSHFLDQIYEICDRMTVLRNGTLVGEHMVERTRPGRPDPADDRQGPGPAGGAPRAAAARRRRRDPARRRTASAARAASPPSTWRSRRARSSASPACSARAAPNSPGCSSAPTSPTAARSPSAASRSR